MNEFSRMTLGGKVHLCGLGLRLYLFELWF